jgi:hypothetical protein
MGIPLPMNERPNLRKFPDFREVSSISSNTKLIYVEARINGSETSCVSAAFHPSVSAHSRCKV